MVYQLVFYAGAALAVLALLLYIVGVFNHIVRLKQNIENSFGNVDTVLKQRHDELPALLDVCKGYMKHERDTLEAVAAQRSGYRQAHDPEEKIRIENSMQQNLDAIRMLWENYPDLIANTNFLALQKRISELETRIADRREHFNACVALYNTLIKQFPPVLVAKVFSFQERSFLAWPEENLQQRPATLMTGAPTPPER